MTSLTRVLARVPFYPLLFAGYAVLYVYAQNLGEVLPTDLVAPLGRSLIGAVMVFAFAALAYRDWRRGALLASTIVVGASVFGLVEPGLARLTGLGDSQLLLLWLGLVAAAAVIAARIQTPLGTLTMALNAFAIVLIGQLLLTILPYETARAARPPQTGPLTGSAIAATRVPDRDVYLIVLDRYGSDWSIEHRFGITDNDLPDWLASQGFEVIPGARANYRGTDLSLASMLNMTMLDQLTETMGRSTDDRTPVRQMLQRTEVAGFLQANGYRYYHLGSWWDGTLTNEQADEMLSLGDVTEFDQVLRDSSVLPTVDQLAGSGTPDRTFTDHQRSIIRFQFRQLQRLAGMPGRKFVFAHILLPHPPYIFHGDGTTVTLRESQELPEAALYRWHLEYANRNIRDVVSTLLSGPDDSDPIIVITGDEGPYVAAGDRLPSPVSPETLGIRLGVLAAYYLPGLPPDTMPPDHTSVNTFRVIFSEYFGADLPRLPDRSFNHLDSDHVYDFRDVTDMLPLPTD